MDTIYGTIYPVIIYLRTMYVTIFPVAIYPRTIYRTIYPACFYVMSKFEFELELRIRPELRFLLGGFFLLCQHLNSTDL